jgi:uncharacterized protein YjbI with pentapeptide repeats
MANDEHVAMLKKGGVDAWNAWRRKNPDIRPDLIDANLSGAHLMKADLSGAHLMKANLSGAHLMQAGLMRAHLGGADLSKADLNEAFLAAADLTFADLSGAKLTRAILSGAHLTGADLTGADLTMAHLIAANLMETKLAGATLTGSYLSRTVFGLVALTKVQGLDHCAHSGPSIIDFLTLQMSGPLPIAFLRGVGLSDRLIEYLPSLLNAAIQFYSCFISYSSKDAAFAERLHADLQNKGVRCWFAPHDLPIGAKVIDALDEAIQLRDKVLLILSEGAIGSDWVEGEVTRALDEERTRKQVVLFPVRIDDAVMQTSEAWARLLRAQYRRLYRLEGPRQPTRRASTGSCAICALKLQNSSRGRGGLFRLLPRGDIGAPRSG